MPATHNQIRRAAGVEEMLAFAHRQLIIKTGNPAEFLIEIRGTAFCGHIIRVLRPGRVAADLWLVVHRLAVSKGAQEHQSVREALFSLELERVVIGVSAVHNIGKGSVLRIGPSRLRVAGPGRGILVRIEQHLQVSGLGANVSNFEQNLAGQLMLDVEIPLIRNRRVQVRADA